MPQNDSEQNPSAIASFIAGLTGAAADVFSLMNYGTLQFTVTFVLIIGFLFAVFGVIAGFIAMLQLRRSGARPDMRRLAVIGFSAGLLSSVISGVFVIALIAALPPVAK